MTHAAHSSEECRRFFAKLSEYLDGELDEITCGAIKRHAASCIPCEACLETLKRTVEICRNSGEVPVPEAFSRRLKTMMKDLAFGKTDAPPKR
jgi:anti-sigma factor RsiW